MKKLLRFLLPTLVLTALLCVSAWAAEEPTIAGLYGVSGTGVTLTPKTADGTEIVKTDPVTGYENFYQDAAKFDLTYANEDITEGSQYLLLVCSGTGAPAEANIVYVNQAAAEADDAVSFTDVYPSSLTKGDYRIFVVGAGSTYAEATPTATFSYFVPYKLGDVDDDGKINTNDAVLVLKHCAEMEELEEGSTKFLAADVDKSGNLNTNDAVQILKYVAELITNFD